MVTQHSDANYPKGPSFSSARRGQTLSERIWFLISRYSFLMRRRFEIFFRRTVLGTGRDRPYFGNVTTDGLSIASRKSKKLCCCYRWMQATVRTCEPTFSTPPPPDPSSRSRNVAKKLPSLCAVRSRDPLYRPALFCPSG